MARILRVVVAGAPMHVIQRGNNRSPVFLDIDDFNRYRDVLFGASKRYECAIHAYVLMTNHVHLLLTPGRGDGPARMMQSLGRVYVRYFNKRYNRTGTLWEGRYRSTLVDSERYFLTCSCYIELNPVRARMTERPDHYIWSSYRHNALGESDSLITSHALYRSLSPNMKTRQAAYRALFDKPPGADAIHDIRRATNRGTTLGDAAFSEAVEAIARRPTARLAHGGDRRGRSVRPIL